MYWYAMEERVVLDWWESVAWWWGTVLMEAVKGIGSLVDGFVEIVSVGWDWTLIQINDQVVDR